MSNDNEDSLTDNIEPQCNFGYIVAREVRLANDQINDLHEELYQNGYIDDIKALREYVEKKQEEHENRIDFKHKMKIGIWSGVAGASTAALLGWLLSII